MIRQSLLYLSGAAWARNIVTKWGVSRRVARRFVAGETLNEALDAAQSLNDEGILVTLDYLGESVLKAEDAEEVVTSYLALLDGIHLRQIQASVSLKLTHLGLDISEDLCMTNLRHLLTCAKEHGLSVTIDMESSHYTETTLRLYRTLRDEYDFANVGTVIQSYLFRSDADMAQLATENAHIRLVKGAYLEPPEIAYADKADVDAAFVRQMEAYLSAGTDAYLCIATHDENIISKAQTITHQHNISKNRYEYQMLYGIRRNRQLELAQVGETVRVYLPYGVAWYPYFMRRLAERPANLWFFLRSFFS